MTTSKREYLTYKIRVDSDKDYEIKLRIGDAQDGDHNVFGDCPYNTEPENNNPIWISRLGTGNEIRNKTLYVSSVTQENNPNTNYVSIRLFINNDQIMPSSGNPMLTVDDTEIVYFNQKILFE